MGAFGMLDVAFPLTLALSPRERQSGFRPGSRPSVGWFGLFGRQVDLGPDESRCFAGDLMGEAAFSQRDSKAAFAAIVSAFDRAAVDQRSQGQVQLLFALKVAARRQSSLEALDAFEI